jgi:hypothetical protein
MSNRWVVSPDVERVPFDEGREWLELKRELTYGDRRVIRSRMVTGVTQPAGDEGPKYSVDPTAHELATVEAYLVAWSLKGADDKPLDISTTAKKRAVLETVLSEEAFGLVSDAVRAHIEAQDAKKKETSTGPLT